jgi:hypothetical protein
MSFIVAFSPEKDTAGEERLSKLLPGLQASEETVHESRLFLFLKVWTAAHCSLRLSEEG